MPWVETESLSFAARHESDEAEVAAAVLEELEGFRERLGELFDTTPWDVSVVIHPGPAQLYLAQPWLPLARMAAAPASRRYFSGWFSSREIHVLSLLVLRERASNVPGSREAMQLAPLHEYVYRVSGDIVGSFEGVLEVWQRARTLDFVETGPLHLEGKFLVT